MVKVKICGLKRVQDIEIVNNFCPDYAGFVFAPSKRQISIETAQLLKTKLDHRIKSVGVFVNEPIESLLAYEAVGVIDLIQLHGDEDLVYIKTLKKTSHLPIIKAFRIQNEESLKACNPLLYSEMIDHALLDTYKGSQYGGCGQCFDWQLLEKVKRPYFLAGGIGEDNIEEALRHLPYAVDISSKLETDGCKDPAKVKAIFDKIRSFSEREQELNG